MTWLGTPWHHAARLKGAGVDCAMFLAEVYERAGLIPHVEVEPYPRDWHLHRGEERFMGWVEKFGSKVEEGDPQPGDVVLFKYGRCVSHGAIVVEWPGSIVHAYMLARCVTLTRSDDGDLAGRFAGAWRIAP
jgi:cell wall-associated NlpC family hydrolase